MSVVAAEADHEDPMAATAAQRRWIVDELAALVAARGADQLLVGPLLEPTPRFFPDRWAGGDASLRLLVRRLLGYAGLGELAVTLEVHDPGAAGRGLVVAKPRSADGPEFMVWLTGHDGAGVTLGVEGAAMADPPLIVAAAARVVAYIYRRAHKLPTRDAFDPRIDLTTVYLGFGLLTAEAARRHTVKPISGTFKARHKAIEHGFLAPQAMCHALAVQLRARELQPAEVQRLCGHLQANQAAYLRHALATIDGEEPPLRRQLELPARDRWPTPPPLERFTAPLAGDGSDAAPEVRRDRDPGVAGVNVGEPVFRVERTMAARLARSLGMGALILGGLFARMRTGVEFGAGMAAFVAVLLGLAGYVLGRFLRESRCSEPRCGATLTAADRVCPRCGGDVVGVIHHPDERMGAEEAWRRDHPDADDQGEAATSTVTTTT